MNTQGNQVVTTLVEENINIQRSYYLTWKHRK